MTTSPTPATHGIWTGRLAAANAAVLVLLKTVLTAPAVVALLRFDPGRFGSQPWTALTYPFVHAGLSHLAATTALLLWLGPGLERRMGSRLFLLFYLYAAAGAAGVAIALAALIPIPPLSGALAPILGLVYARAWFAEDEDVSLAPLPFRVRIRAVAALACLVLLVLGLVLRRESLSAAHLGGVAAGWLFFRIARFGRRPQAVVPMPLRRPAMAPVRLSTPSTAGPAPQVEPRTTSMGVEDAAEAINRVLDKISASGFESLTPQERRLLTQYAERKRRDGG
jgi:membrane associated rhomboid family serine protease